MHASLINPLDHGDRVNDVIRPEYLIILGQAPFNKKTGSARASENKASLPLSRAS